MIQGVPGDTLIACVGGDRPIVDIVNGDMVLTRPRRGRSIYHRVSKVFRRRVTRDEMKMLSFCIGNDPVETLWLTEHHLVQIESGLWVPPLQVERPKCQIIALCGEGTQRQSALATITGTHRGLNVSAPYVYDLSVENDGAYYANGVRVCAQ